MIVGILTKSVKYLFNNKTEQIQPTQLTFLLAYK